MKKAAIANRSFLYFSLGLAVFCFAGCGPDMRAYKSYLKEDFTQLAATGTVSERTFTIEKDGPLAPLMQAMNHHMAEAVKVKQDYQRKTRDININLYLKPERLTSIQTIVFSRERVMTLQQAYQDMNTTFDTLHDSLKKEIEGLDIPPDAKQFWIENDRIERISEEPKIAKSHQAFLDYTESVLKLLDFMEIRTDDCGLSNGSIVFKREADTKQYELLVKQTAQCKTNFLKSLTRMQKSALKGVKKL